MTEFTDKNNFIINRQSALAITGHREIPADLDLNRLKKAFYYFIDEKGIDTFLIGMAVGFDSLCFNILEKIRKERNIQLIACIPCLNQDRNFSILQKIEYKKMLKSADQRVLLKEKYDKYCMLERNAFMVDNARLVLACIRKNTGGTAYTVRYANKNNVPVIKI